MEKSIFSPVGKAVFAIVVFLCVHTFVTPVENNWGFCVMILLGFLTVIIHNGFLYGAIVAIERDSHKTKVFWLLLDIGLLFLVLWAWTAWYSPDIDPAPKKAVLFVLLNVTGNCTFAGYGFFRKWGTLTLSKIISA